MGVYTYMMYLDAHLGIHGMKGTLVGSMSVSGRLECHSMSM